MGVINIQNKKAYFDYEILEKYETGIVLKGTEIKSIKAGNVNLKDSFILIRNGEVFLKNAHISPYEFGNINNVDPMRDRKLLLSKNEIIKLDLKKKQLGATLVPLKMYFKGNFVKLEIALAKGKKAFDKRKAEKEKEAQKTINAFKNI